MVKSFSVTHMQDRTYFAESESLYTHYLTSFSKMLLSLKPTVKGRQQQHPSSRCRLMKLRLISLIMAALPLPLLSLRAQLLVNYVRGRRHYNVIIIYCCYTRDGNLRCDIWRSRKNDHAFLREFLQQDSSTVKQKVDSQQAKCLQILTKTLQ